MSWWEILLIVAAAGFVVAVIGCSVRRKLQGKSSCSECGGHCEGCPGCARKAELPQHRDPK